ncbi:MAG: LPXTG cell wall anchor domain-containing protein, partial [Clostridia bacterium]|nr:LPXTG cell wall anchor domain-containing protein [Clostridia bacterium]
RDGAKAGYQYKIIGQTDIEPSQTESVNGLKISGAIPDGAEFKAVATTTKWFKDPIFCYEITLNKDGAVVQPDGYVTIYIPCEYSNGYVVHVDEETGEMENRNSIYVDGYYVFVTDHLSEYGIKFDSEPVKSEVSQPEQSQSEQSQPEQSQPEQSQPEQSQPEQPQSEQSQPEQSQPEQSQPINPDNNVPKTGDSPITAAALIVTAAISGAFVLGIRKRNANHI